MSASKSLSDSRHSFEVQKIAHSSSVNLVDLTITKAYFSNFLFLKAVAIF